MSREIPEEEAASIAEYGGVVTELSRGASLGFLWYRGLAKRSYELVPSLYRSPLTELELFSKEQRMLAAFRARSRPFAEHQSIAPSPESSGWQFLFLMQHYGAPTRLLDWSENAFVALYFAISAAAEEDFSEDAVVCLLDPGEWNVQVVPKMITPGEALYEGASALRNYAPDADPDTMANGVVAMFATFNNPRITAQRGVFTVFGLGKGSMETAHAAFEAGDPILHKVIIPRDALPGLRDDLDRLGFRESMIYPGLAEFAAETRRLQGL